MLADDLLKEWFAARLKEHTLLRYHAQLQNRPQPRIPDLGTSVTPANPEVWPLQPRGAFKFYVLHLAEPGMGNVSAFSAFIDDRFVMVVRARTQNDDGAIEVYDEHGLLLAAARSYFEVIAWGDLDWLRAQFKDEPVLPPELADGKDRTLWGMPIEGHHCCEAREHPCRVSPPGRCNGTPGHLALGKPHKCFRCGFTWGLPETEEEAIELAEDWTPESETEAEEAIELAEDWTPEPQTEAEEAIELAEDPALQTEADEAIELAEDWTPPGQTEIEEAIELPEDPAPQMEVAEATPPDPRTFVRPRFELRLRDGRTAQGVLQDHKVKFETRLGSVTVFAADIKHIDFALANSHDTTNAIASAVHQLGGATQKQAEQELLSIGDRAFPALIALAQCGNEPVHRRARALAARIRATTTPELLNLRTSHQVTTPDATFAANFPPDTSGLSLETDAGCQSFENSDLLSLHQLPGPTVDVPRPNPGWLGRFFTNWYGAKLSFMVTGDPDEGSVMGSNPYTLDSMLAAAAVHAGFVKAGETKVVRVEIMLAPAKFAGSTRNGVESLDWEEPTTGAFRFLE